MWLTFIKSSQETSTDACFGAGEHATSRSEMATTAHTRIDFNFTFYSSLFQSANINNGKTRFWLALVAKLGLHFFNLTYHPTILPILSYRPLLLKVITTFRTPTGFIAILVY
jgi:hypothetical protein